MRLRPIPMTLDLANRYIAVFHRHHKPVQGHRFSLGAAQGDNIVGVVIVGRPVARGCDPYKVAEVSRLCTEGGKNVCSFLYAAAARVCKEMGFERIQTYILESEPGISLKAAGWIFEGNTAGGDWNHSAAYAGKRRTDQPMVPKQRWIRELRG